MSMKHRQGVSTIGIVIGVVVLLLAGGVVWYMVSDPFSTRVNNAAEQMTKWTPENIAKDPKGYLDFCQQQTEKALEGLKADEIRLAQSKGKLEQMRDEADKQIQAGEKVLKELVPAYSTAKESNSFPISFRNNNLNQEQARKQIGTLDRQVENQKTLKGKAEAGLRKLEAEAGKIDDLRTKAKEQLAEIDYNRQLLNANKLSEDLKTRLVNMQGAIAATVNAAASTDGTVSLSELTAEQGSAPADDKAIDAALSKYK